HGTKSRSQNLTELFGQNIKSAVLDQKSRRFPSQVGLLPSSHTLRRTPKEATQGKNWPFKAEMGTTYAVAHTYLTTA
ncbi:MAG TPA: hypothetical protein PK971_13995, partial [Saprospiraceae bacterium]|nr:hypothetical protein [Saprospiraceae bacterium]